MSKKLKIMYNNELIATIDEGQKATICCNNKKMAGDLVLTIISETPVEPELILNAPSISLDGDILTITTEDDRTEAFVVLVDDVEETDVPTLTSGTWYFDGITNLAIEENASFISNGVSYTRIRYEMIPVDDKSPGTNNYLYYDDTLVFEKQFESVDTWTNEAYRYIRFDTVQNVSQEFRNWLQACAQPIEDPIYQKVFMLVSTFGSYSTEPDGARSISLLRDVNFYTSSGGTLYTAFNTPDGDIIYTEDTYRIMTRKYSWIGNYDAILSYVYDIGETNVYSHLRGEENGNWYYTDSSDPGHTKNRTIMSFTRVTDKNGYLFYRILQANASLLSEKDIILRDNWLANETLVLPNTSISEDFYINFDSMYCNNITVTNNTVTVYSTLYKKTITLYQNGKWVYNWWRNISFSSIALVSKAFKDWFIANAKYTSFRIDLAWLDNESILKFNAFIIPIGITWRKWAQTVKYTGYYGDPITIVDNKVMCGTHSLRTKNDYDDEYIVHADDVVSIQPKYYFSIYDETDSPL